MADNAFSWAETNGLIRVNEMHGEQEAKLILDDEFHHDQQQSEHVEQTSRMDVEELCMH